MSDTRETASHIVPKRRKQLHAVYRRLKLLNTSNMCSSYEHYIVGVRHREIHVAVEDQGVNGTNWMSLPVHCRLAAGVNKCNDPPCRLKCTTYFSNHAFPEQAQPAECLGKDQSGGLLSTCMGFSGLVQ